MQRCCSFTVSNNGQHRLRPQREREDTRHGSNAGEIKPQTRQRHWQPAGRTPESVSLGQLSHCPSACRSSDDFEARRGHMRASRAEQSQVHFALAVQKFNQEVQRARRVQHPQAGYSTLSTHFLLPLSLCLLLMLLPHRELVLDRNTRQPLACNARFVQHLQ